MDKETLYESMKEAVNEFNPHDPDYCQLRLCLDLTLYVKGDIHTHRDSLLKFYDLSTELIADRVTYYLADTSNKFKKCRKDTVGILPYWLDSEKDMEVAILSLSTDNHHRSASEYSFDIEMIKDYLGFVRLTLPIDFILDNVPRYLGLCLEMAQDFEFVHGHAGFGTKTSILYHSMEGDRQFAISRRYRGIDLGQPAKVSSFGEEHIKCVNWLTFVGKPLLDKVGGVTTLEKQLADQASIHPLNYGVMIQAGPEPLFGDVNKKETLLRYHAVGKALASIRAGVSEYRSWDGIGGEVNTRAWLARFD